MEPAFRALADPSRRLLLDRLFDRDGQTLGELCSYLPDMTRFGVMKHLAVLEEAQIVTTRRVGREKRHYLNPVQVVPLLPTDAARRDDLGLLEDGQVLHHTESGHVREVRAQLAERLPVAIEQSIEQQAAARIGE